MIKYFNMETGEPFTSFHQLQGLDLALLNEKQSEDVWDVHDSTCRVKPWMIQARRAN